MQVGGFAPARPPYGEEYILGEEQDEWVIPASARGKFPSHTGQTQSGRGSGKGGGVTINVDLTGAVVGDVEHLADLIAEPVGLIMKENKGGASSNAKEWNDDRA